MAKKMSLTVEKGEIELGKSGVTIQIRDAANAKIARIHLSRAALRYYERDKGKPNLKLNIDQLLVFFQTHHDYKK